MSVIQSFSQSDLLASGSGRAGDAAEQLVQHVVDNVITITIKCK